MTTGNTSETEFENLKRKLFISQHSTNLSKENCMQFSGFYPIWVRNAFTRIIEMQNESNLVNKYTFNQMYLEIILEKIYDTFTEDEINEFIEAAKVQIMEKKNG